MKISRPLFYALFLLFLLTPFGGGAQNRLIDSIRNNLRAAKTPVDVGNAYVDLCFYHRYINIDTALYYGQKALDIAQKNKLLQVESKALNNLGLSYRELGDFPKSLELQFKALKIANDNHFILERGLCYRRIGLIFLDLKNYPAALDYHLKAVKDHLAVNDVRNLSIDYQNLGGIYLRLNEIDSSRAFLMRSYATKEYAIDLNADLCSQMGTYFMAVDRRDSALTYLRAGLYWCTVFNDNRNFSNLNVQIAELFAKENNLDSSLFYAYRSIAYGQKAKYTKGLFEAYDILARVYQKSDPVKAYHYLALADSTKENLFGTNTMRLLQSATERELKRQNEAEDASRQYQNNLRLIVVIAFLVVVVVVTLLLYRNNRLKAKDNAVLQKTLTELKSTQAQLVQSEKMASLGELTAGIAHEIQNPLNFVNNFSEVSNELIAELKAVTAKPLEQRDPANETDLLNDIASNLEKINHHGKRADGIVKGMLQHSRSGSGKKEPTDLVALCDEYLRLAYHGYRAKDNSFNAEFELKAADNLPLVKVVPQEMGRVILNLINNAFYAVNERAKSGSPTTRGTDGAAEKYLPKVLVKVDEFVNPDKGSKGNSSPDASSPFKTGRTLRIRVEDNGKGIPPSLQEKIFQPFFTTKPTGQGTGLGLSLSYDIVKAHGGSLQMDSTEGLGTSFEITLPV